MLKKRVYLEIFDDGLEFLEIIARVTHKEEVDISRIVRDMTRTYQWILEHQLKRKTIVALDEEAVDALKMGNDGELSDYDYLVKLIVEGKECELREYFVKLDEENDGEQKPVS
jgi:predicted enzyme involved in methoxymalonyl-ACP biosynthesis